MEGYDDRFLSFFVCAVFGVPFIIWFFAFIFKIFIYNPYTYFCEPKQSYVPISSSAKSKVEKPTRPVQSSYDSQYELDLPFED